MSSNLDWAVCQLCDLGNILFLLVSFLNDKANNSISSKVCSDKYELCLVYDRCSINNISCFYCRFFFFLKPEVKEKVKGTMPR